MNRSIRREKERELERYYELLDFAQGGFFKQLFEDNTFTYEELFEHYNHYYIDSLNWIERHRKFKHIQPDKNYFKNEYQPKENIR